GNYTTTAAVTATPTPESNVLFMSIQMVSATDGWAVAQGASEYILHTHDGATTWADVSPRGIAGDHSAAPYFLDDSHAWIVSGQTIWATRDGGRVWDSASVDAANSGGSMMSFGDVLHGVVVFIDCCAASNIAFTTFTTTDGGKSWQQVS